MWRTVYVDRYADIIHAAKPRYRRRTTGSFRHLADDGRHVAGPAVRFVGFSVGAANTALVVIFTVAQQAGQAKTGCVQGGAP
jgi:hypothetical protein